MLNVPQQNAGHAHNVVPGYANVAYPAYVNAIPQADDSGELIDLDRLLAAARRQWWVVCLFALAGLALGIAYIVTAVPLYTSSVDILIDKSRSRVIDQLTVESGVFQDEAETLSQIELLKSEALARNVVNGLNLVDNPVFMDGAPSLVSLAAGLVRQLVNSGLALVADSDLAGSDVPAATEDEVQRAIGILRDNTAVERVGRTYVLRLRYESPSPQLSAAIAGAFGAAYLEDQLQSKFDATTRAGDWLQDRIAELRDQAYEADIAVQQFRIEHNLIAAGGRLVSEQQLSEINTQLIAAQAATAEARARVEQLEDLIQSGKTDAVVNDALVSSTINALRTRYLNTSRLKTEIEARLGPTHIQVVRLRDEMVELERLIFSELERIAESYRSSYNVALSREESLRNSLDEILGVNALANTTQVQLRELEREAETFRTLYTSFLRRHQETVQQQTFPISDARIISPAAAPKAKSSPRTGISLALFLMLGLASGVGVGAFREYRDRFFRTADQVRSETHAEFLGYLPAIRKLSGAREEPGSLWQANSLYAYVRSHPMSPFSETLRNVKVAADLALPDNDVRTIGVVSCLPSEGKSTVSTNLANLIAQQGSRVALVDGDLRNPGLTRSLARRPQQGLVEAIAGDVDIDRELPLLFDHGGRLSVLPTVLNRRISHTSDLLASAQMDHVLQRLKADHDYVIVDLPPAGPVVDAKAFAGRIDAFVFVVEWGRTSRLLVRNTIEHTPVFRDKCLGVILNKCDERKMKLYRSFGSEEYYYSSKYKSYYQS